MNTLFQTLIRQSTRSFSKFSPIRANIQFPATLRRLSSRAFSTQCHSSPNLSLQPYRFDFLSTRSTLSRAQSISQTKFSNTYWRFSIFKPFPHTPLIPLSYAVFPFEQQANNQQIQLQKPGPLSRDLDIDFYACEANYKQNITYVDTPDVVVNIRQIQRIIMKDAFLCKKYCRYIIETVEDAKRIIEQAEKRLGTMIEVTQHEPTNQIYRRYILKLDEEREALDGYLNLGLLCVMPVATITKHFKNILDEKHNDGGLGAEFILAQEQFDIVHQQLNQLQELSAKCDGLVELSDECVQAFLKEMASEVESLQENQLPSSLRQFHGEQDLSSIYFDKNGRSTNKYVPEAEIERVFLEIKDPLERNKELERIARTNRAKTHKADRNSIVNYREDIRKPSPAAKAALETDPVSEIEDVYDENGKWVGARVRD